MKRILVVDDEEAILGLLKEFLEGQGHKVWVCTKTSLALDLFKKESFDLIISDYSIDQRNGLQLSQEVLNINPKMPIIIISGNIPESEEMALLKIGVRFVLEKPFKLSKVRMYIKMCFLPNP